MSFLKKIFSAGGRLAGLRRAIQQQRWADALAEGEGVNPDPLTVEEREELLRLLTTAGDALARINLAEGEACLRAGDRSRAREHFSLAAGQARDGALREQADAFLRPDRPLASPSVPLPANPSCCPSGCGTSPAVSETDSEAGDLDVQTRLDLILAGYPPELAQRYFDSPETFRAAFLLAHEGLEEQALTLLEQIPAAQHDPLYHFERGSLLARSGAGNQAIPELEKAATIAPVHPLAAETLVNLELSMGLDEAAEQRLRKMLADGFPPAFCHGRLALIQARHGDLAAALETALTAIRAGADVETYSLAANLLERAGRLDEAEACLARLASPGCGSQNLPLAEFWLRRGRHLDRALEAFKAGVRQEPENPRWRLRIAQAYLGLGWRREGVPLLEKALAAPGLDPDLRREGEALLDAGA